MKIRRWILPASLVLALAACAVPEDSYDYDGDGGRGRQEHRHHRHNDDRRDRSETRDENFQCDNGLEVRIEQMDEDRIRLTTDGKSVIMKNAATGSGVRYTSNRGLYGAGGEWHQKGSEAVFTYAKMHGGSAEVSCSRQ